jgi:folate-dependent phosphoribosylglycinamide formyltransferase PurN
VSSASPLRTVVLVSGSGSNLQAIIDHAQSGSLGIRLTGVISDRPGVLALERARRASIPALTIDHAQAGSSAAFQQQLGTALAELDPQLVVLAGFMRILSPDSSWTISATGCSTSILRCCPPIPASTPTDGCWLPASASMAPPCIW